MTIQLNFTEELVIDNFAGGGGASTGIELALSRPVDIAINHDPDAIAIHKANHQYTQHYCESVWDINPREAVKGRKVALAWFSPDCKHFSKAKGGKPVSKNIRGLAWVAVRWAATVKPRIIMLENVEEFKTWGPLVDGQPDINQKGRTFNSFINALKAQGYDVEWRELRACDYGAPTIRKRFFLIARSDGQKIVWPKPTHGANLIPYRTAADIIDWSIPCPSIFDTSEQVMATYGLKAVRPLADNTLRRIARGIQKFVIDSPEPFIIQVNHSGGDFRGQDINKPLQTVKAKHGYGIVTPSIVKFQQNSLGKSLDKPIDTIMAGATRFGLLAPTLIQYHSETTSHEVRGQSINEPIMTIDSSPRYAMAAATLIQTGYGEAPGQSPRVPGVDKPLGTVVSGCKHAVVTAFMSEYFSGGNNAAGDKMVEPLDTVTSLDHNALVTSHLCVLRNNQDGKSMTEPMPTVMTSPGHFAEVRAFLIKYYGQGTGQRLDAPLDTITARDRFGIVTIQGTEYAIVDIGLRMLTPRELYNAQGFPIDYIIDQDFEGKQYPKNKQVARCGNAVPPVFAEALVRANLPELCGRKVTTMAELEKEIAI